MKNSSKERTLQWISNQYGKGNISFSHKLQRPIGQWKLIDKSLLIHSLLSGIPINPIYIVEENGVMYTLDGSQRTSTCIDYVNNKFALSKDTPNIKIDSKENGETILKEYEIAGKKFKKLDKEVQSTLLACGLEFCTLSEYTEDEVKEMFKRQNAGKPVGAKLLRICNESDKFSDAIYDLIEHPFMKKIVSNTQHKNGTDRDLIIQTFMLILTNDENDFTSFRSRDIDTFIENHSIEVLEKVEILKETLDQFNNAYNENENLKIPNTSIPMILYSGYEITNYKKSFSKLIEMVNEFLETYDTNEEYKQFVQNATGSAQNVKGRFEWWKEKIKTI